MELNIANPFASRKFVYALAGFLAALVLALLPAVFPNLPPATLEMIEWSLPRVLAGAGLLLGGHILSDETSKLLGLQIKPLLDMTEELIEAIPLGEREPETSI